MKLRSFITLLGIVALVAVIYSPSTIGISVNSGFGSTSPSDVSQSGTSQFLTFLRQSGYQVTLVNTTQQEVSLLSGATNGKRLAYFLIGPDLPLTTSEVQTVSSHYLDGSLSLLIADGNTTNSALLNSLFSANVTGAAIVDPTSSFKDQRVFTVTLHLGSEQTVGVIDIASPIILNSQALKPAAITSPYAYDTLNPKPGTRNVVVSGTTRQGSRVVLISDSAPFTNYLSSYQGADEKAFYQLMVGWVVPDKGTQIIFDNSHYRTPAAPKPQFGLPIGPLVTYALEQDLLTLDTYYTTLPSQAQGLMQTFHLPFPDVYARIAITLVVLYMVYGALKRWFAPEKKGRDDQPLPNVERAIVAESKARIDFLRTSRSKSFYVATIAQLYEVLDTIAVEEFGASIPSIYEPDLAGRLGEKRAREAVALFAQLSRVYQYATGKRRFLFPPILRWKAKVSILTRETESLLNQLGMTITGSEESRAQVEYTLRGRGDLNAVHSKSV